MPFSCFSSINSPWPAGAGCVFFSDGDALVFQDAILLIDGILEGHGHSLPLRSSSEIDGSARLTSSSTATYGKP